MRTFLIVFFSNSRPSTRRSKSTILREEKKSSFLFFSLNPVFSNFRFNRKIHVNFPLEFTILIWKLGVKKKKKRRDPNSFWRTSFPFLSPHTSSPNLADLSRGETNRATSRASSRFPRNSQFGRLRVIARGATRSATWFRVNSICRRLSLPVETARKRKRRVFVAPEVLIQLRVSNLSEEPNPSGIFLFFTKYIHTTTPYCRGNAVSRFSRGGTDHCYYI